MDGFGCQNFKVATGGQMVCYTVGLVVACRVPLAG